MIDVLRRLLHFGKCIIKYLMQGTALCIENTNRIWKTLFVHIECFSEFLTKVYCGEIFLTTIVLFIEKEEMHDNALFCWKAGNATLQH